MIRPLWLALAAALLAGCGRQPASPIAPPTAPIGTRVAASAPGPGDGENPPQPPPVATKGKGWSGVNMGPRTPTDNTLVIKAVTPDSPADKAGLKVGDLVLKKNGEPIADWEAFKAWIQSLTPDTRYTLTVQREGKELECVVTVGVRPQSAEGGGRLAPPAALAAGMKWLAEQQLESGAWPHAYEKQIGQKGDPNPAVTGLAVSALSLTRESRAQYAQQIARGLDYMLKSETPKGYLANPDDQMKYGNFATAEAIIVMARLDKAKYKDAIAKFVAYFEKCQIGEANGFQPYDWPYGAWDYFDDIRPRPMRADLVLASMVIEALHAADVPKTAPVMQKALQYVMKCQNWKDSASDLTQLDDGGFFFTPREGKAGEANVGGGSNLRFHSYGTVTCDGIRSLLALGEPKDGARVKAAVEWLSNNYNLEVVPGFPDTPAARATDYEHGLRYYYYMALAKALDACGEATLKNNAGASFSWAPDLAAYIAKLQRADGSWANGVPVMNENNPILATGMAVHALAIALGHANGK